MHLKFLYPPLQQAYYYDELVIVMVNRWTKRKTNDSKGIIFNSFFKQGTGE